MPKLLTDEQMDSYRLKGFLFPIQVMDMEEARQYRIRLEACETQHPDYMTGIKRQKLHLVTTWMAELICWPNILDAVEDILGPNLLCWQTSLFIKEVNDPGFVSLHQDGNYWGLSSQEVVTAWLALSPSTVESGCMKMLAGSHKWHGVQHKDTFEKNNLLTRGQTMQVDMDDSQATHVTVEPGQISLHHVNIAHASEPNKANDRRIGIAIRYVTPTVRQMTGIPDSATLVRGEDRIGNFELEVLPSFDFDPLAVALHERVTATRSGFIYKDAVQRP